MTILNILEFPDPRLRTIAEPVKRMDREVNHLINDMFETMYCSSGIGLSATQVNVHKRIIVVDISTDKSEPMVFINPSINLLSNRQIKHQEGCLSIPGSYADVSRPQYIEVNYWDANGKTLRMLPEGLLSICIQHECDHLNGKLFIDHLSTLKYSRIKKKIKKNQSIKSSISKKT